MTDTSTYLSTCKQLIEQSLNWGDSSRWTNEDFENLSDEIEEKTQVRLSVSTLKRIWGRVKYDSSPTAATLNALAKFIGYENWRQFLQKNKQGQVIEEPVTPLVTEANIQPVAQPAGAVTPVLQPVKQPTRLWTVKSILAVSVLSTAIIASLSLVTIFRAKKANVNKNAIVVFESKKTSDDLPNSVVFNYNASAFHSDSVYIQQSWDPSRRQKIPGDGRQVTSIYYYPGYFNTKLIVDGEIKKEIPVFIQTKGWKGIIKHDPAPMYLTAAEIKTAGGMGITSATLTGKTNTPVFNDVWTEFANVRPFNADSTDFSLETTLRNTATVEQSLCRNIRVLILCKGSAIILPLCDKGCISNIGVLAGFDYIDGKNHDLSGFGCDMRQLQHISCTVKNKRMVVTLNNTEILNIPQSKPVGDIIGIRYEFEGPAEVKDVRLASHGKVVYEEKF